MHAPRQERPLARRLLLPALLVAWCALLFAASARPDLEFAESQLVDLVVRKIGHLVAYGVLALLASMTFRQEGATPRGAAIGAFAFAVLYAASDEYHQSFVPGRVGSLGDVVIDACGAALALVGARMLRTRRKQQQP